MTVWILRQPGALRGVFATAELAKRVGDQLAKKKLVWTHDRRAWRAASSDLRVEPHEVQDETMPIAKPDAS